MEPALWPVICLGSPTGAAVAASEWRDGAGGKESGLSGKSERRPGWADFPVVHAYSRLLSLHLDRGGFLAAAHRLHAWVAWCGAGSAGATRLTRTRRGAAVSSTLVSTLVGKLPTAS